ncbi:MAG: fibrillarin-like rRNA/tRNA 2'-O-methyltransferase [Candidatus Aenigmarchaeota archaeon]|nr:fibrillarin-like rRNA/tRNA 2'-O-methyltransferase [Candidatus Aenigmarchaeota archaeon]
MHLLFPGIWKHEGRILTRNLIAGQKSLSEELLTVDGTEYRAWDPYHSKPAAAIMKGLKDFPIKEGGKILYLGAANGNTASYFSDIIGMKGIIYGVEISDRAMIDLIQLCRKRRNIAPILANAKLPKEYIWIERVDAVYEDVAARDQTEILIRNCQTFLKKGGYAMIAIKARSIDVVKNPKEIFRQEMAKLKEHFEVAEEIDIEPFEKDHELVVLRMK